MADPGDDVRPPDHARHPAGMVADDEQPRTPIAKTVRRFGQARVIRDRHKAALCALEQGLDVHTGLRSLDTGPETARCSGADREARPATSKVARRRMAPLPSTVSRKARPS